MLQFYFYFYFYFYFIFILFQRYACPLLKVLDAHFWVALHISISGAPDAWNRISRELHAAETLGEKIVLCCTHAQEASSRLLAAWLMQRYGMRVNPGVC